MGIKDLIVTPVIIFLVYLLAYTIRSRVTDRATRKFFIPALSLKILGAISLGLVYQFYYGGGGDTFTYYFKDAGVIWEAFLDSPPKAFQLLWAQGQYYSDSFQYASRIYTYTDLPTYFVVRVTGIFSILTGHTYSAIAVIFAAISFSGMWALYLTLQKLYPFLSKQLAIAVLFIPSVFFWGSGILKDTVIMGAIGWATFAMVQVFFGRGNRIIYSLILVLSLYTMYVVKIFILSCFLPAAIFWILYGKFSRIQSGIAKFALAPILLVFALALSYYSVGEISEDSNKYSLTQLSETAKISAEWLAYVGQIQGGSVYTLGDYDYSPTGLVKKFPLALWVTFFRPYPWEANNPVMLLSSLESFLLLLMFIGLLIRARIFKLSGILFKEPFVVFCLVFSISFAFAIGISTYNFGSLVRYKIPIIPFFVSALFILSHHLKRRRKFSELELTE